MIPLVFTGGFWAAENGLYAEVELSLNGHHFAVLPVDFDTDGMTDDQIVEKCLRQRLVQLFGVAP